MAADGQFTLYGGFTLPRSSSVINPTNLYLFCGSLIIQHSIFHLLSHTIFAGEEKDKLRARSWILTTVASLVMSVASLPYLWDLFAHGYDFLHVKPRLQTVADPLACFFVAYLISDLALGSIYYRKLINIASGWVHHIVYTFLFTYVMHRRWTYIAATGAIFELPTFVMGIACMFPRLRSNIGFTATFFLTRIIFHFALIVTMATESGRAAPFVDGSWGPFACITLPFPMHVWWGFKAVRSMQRRAAKRKLQKRMKIESDGSLAIAAGQFFNGVAPPDVASALNTPAITPGARGETSFGSTQPVHASNSAFAKAVAATSGAAAPIRLFISRRRSHNRGTGSADASVTPSRSASPGPPSALSGRATPSVIELSQNPFTAPIAPEGADPTAKEPFLAIRSPAETEDRARRLIADAVRKAWKKAPQEWRKQVEAESGMRSRSRPSLGLQLPLGNQRAPSSSGHSSYYVSETHSDDDDDDQGSLDTMTTASTSSSISEERENAYGQQQQQHPGPVRMRRLSSAAADELFDDAKSEVVLTPLASPRGFSSSFDAQQRQQQRGRKAAARRAVIKAVRRAINGKDADGDVLASASAAGGGATVYATRDAAPPQMPGTDPTLRPLDFGTLLKRIPSDLWSQSYQVREFPVERDETLSRRQRILAQIRRRMEVARRDVMVFD